jgi:RNA polymerase sigma factor (sigma-70 family)
MELYKLSDENLKQSCIQETRNFRKKEENDPRYCFELFRRLLTESQTHLLGFLMETYHPLIEHWTRSNPAFEYSELDADELIGSVFVRLVKTCQKDGFDRFEDLAALLAFLKQCVNNLVVDTVRRDKQPPIVPIEDWMDEIINTQEPALDTDLVATDLWNCISRILNDTRDLAIARYSIVQDMKPARIAEEFEDMTAREISIRLHHIRQKLRSRISECS